MSLIRCPECGNSISDKAEKCPHCGLPPDDSCNQVEIVRAINTLLRDVDNQEKRPQRPLPENAGKPWIKADEDTLCKMFDEGHTRKEICDHFKRSSGAIASRLVKLGKIKERDEFRKN